MNNKPLGRLQANFLTGLAVVLPAVISISVVVWLFGTVANITDQLFFAVPRAWKYVNGERGDIHWYWSVAALLLAVALVALVGGLARHYLGRKLIEAGDDILHRVPLLNRIYATVKQVKEAFAGNQSSFKEAVLVEFPQPGNYSLGFLTGDQRNEVQARTRERVWSVFVPTTPNPTTGFLIFVPESKFTRLDMSVADAIKGIISLGSVMPAYHDPAAAPGSGSAAAPPRRTAAPAA